MRETSRPSRPAGDHPETGLGQRGLARQRGVAAAHLRQGGAKVRDQIVEQRVRRRGTLGIKALHVGERSEQQVGLDPAPASP